MDEQPLFGVIASAVLELAALGCISVAAWLVAPALGWLAIGIGLFLVGQAMDGLRGPKIVLPKVKLPKVKIPRPVLRRPGEQT